MGITIVQKSDLSVKKYNAKKALVIAGGAMSGGSFAVGGLKALNDYLKNFDITDFNIFSGISSGALLAASLSAGLGPEEMVRIFNGCSKRFSQFNPFQFYKPNLREFIINPLQFCFELALFMPEFLIRLVSDFDEITGVYDLFKQFLRQPSLLNLENFLAPIFSHVGNSIQIPNIIKMLPQGLCENSGIERYIRKNIEANNWTNNFQELYRTTGRELYITAMDLNTAKEVVFGHNENNSVTISQAVQASTALPGFYKPARINGVDYIDGGVVKTSNMSTAIRHDAQLIICYNPFRPLVTNRSLAASGFYPVFNQTFRTLLYTRLHLGVELHANDPNFKGDIIVIEPDEEDYEFFITNPLVFWSKGRVVEHGFNLVKKAIEKNFDSIATILGSYGIVMTKEYVLKESEYLQEVQSSDESILNIFSSQPSYQIH